MLKKILDLFVSRLFVWVCCVCVFGIGLFLFCLCWCLFVCLCSFSPGLLDLQFAAKSGTPDLRAKHFAGFGWCIRLNSCVRLPAKANFDALVDGPYCTKELNVKQRVLFA